MPLEQKKSNSNSGNYTITDNDLLLRRFPITPNLYSFYKEIDGKYYPTSAAFKTKRDEDGLSVNIKEITHDLDAFVGDKGSFQVAEFSAALPLENDFKCEHDPNPKEDPENYAHALIIGNTQKLAKKISKQSAVVEV